MSPSDFEIAGNAKTLFEIAGIPTIAGIFASLIHSKQVNSHFIVMKRSFRASFNQCQPSEAKGWSKNAFFHILTAVNMRNLKIGSFPEKTESVTS